MINSYAKAYTEVLEILKYLPENEYRKIPKEKLEYYRSRCDNTYKFRLDKDLKNISKEASAIIVSLFRDYFATPKQKENLKIILNNNQKKEEELKREKYNPDNIFKNSTKPEPVEEVINTQMIEYKKENIFKKIFNIIKKIFLKIEPE